MCDLLTNPSSLTFAASGKTPQWGHEDISLNRHTGNARHSPLRETQPLLRLDFSHYLCHTVSLGSGAVGKRATHLHAGNQQLGSRGRERED